MSDLEDYESEVEPEETSDKEDEKLDKQFTSKTPVSSKIKSEIDNSSEDEDDGEEFDDEFEDDLDAALDEDEFEQNTTKSVQDILKKTIDPSELSPINSDVESDDEDDLQKFDKQDSLDYITKFHPECLIANSDEVEALSQVKRENGKIVDKNHITNPILTKYEKTKILGQRTKQLNSGCQPYIDVPKNIIDSYLIAEMELKQKKIPVIIRRPISIHHSEYWKLEDLEQIY